MAKYKILVIDDEKSRIPIYNKLLKIDDSTYNEFEVDFVTDSFSEMVQKDLDSYHCFIIDMCLESENWIDQTNKRDPFDRVIKEIGDKKPIVILSARWDEAASWLNSYFKEYNIIHLIIWNEINASMNSIRTNIFQQLTRIYGTSNFAIGDDEPIRILHVSDLQFGERSNEDSLGVKKNILSSAMLTEIPNHLSNSNLTPHFVVLTGDITENALPSEYILAANWIKELCSNIFFTYQPDKILIVNGNHDYNLSLNALNYFKFEYGSNPDLKMTKLDSAINDFENAAFNPYIDFLKDMNVVNKLTYFNDAFRHIGIRFLHLNTLENYNVSISNKSSLFDITQNTLNELTKSQKTKDILFPIILSHAQPRNLGYMNNEKDELWTRFKNFVSYYRNSLFLCGHEHVDDYLTQIPVKHNGYMYYSGCPTLLSKPNATGISRGFSLITLIRENKRVNRIETQLFNVDTHQAVNPLGTPRNVELKWD